jgi:hypothetical protein
MSRIASNPSLPVQQPVDPVDADLAPLLAEPLASAWTGASGGAALAEDRAAALRHRLGQRVQATHGAEAGMVTVRRRRARRETVATGVTAQTLYRASLPSALRPGEPVRALLIDLAPGSLLDPSMLAGSISEPDCPAEGLNREWLLVSGSATVEGQALSQRDYRVEPAGCVPATWRSDEGALVFLRESLRPDAGAHPFTVLDAEAGWPDFAPGIQRRVLWQHGGEAALLYWAQAGAKVPLHRHGHDEECLMVQGELFLDDLLLQAGDYQLAPAGTGHRITETDTGVVIYAHGDLDLQFIEAE